MSGKKHKNVFAELQKNRKPRKKGLATAPKLQSDVLNTRLPERSEAVASKIMLTRRTYRVSTFISEDAGNTLDELILKIKKLEGKKPKISKVLEMALGSLETNLKI